MFKRAQCSIHGAFARDGKNRDFGVAFGERFAQLAFGCCQEMAIHKDQPQRAMQAEHPQRRIQVRTTEYIEANMLEVSSQERTLAVVVADQQYISIVAGG